MKWNINQNNHYETISANELTDSLSYSLTKDHMKYARIQLGSLAASAAQRGRPLLFVVDWVTGKQREEGIDA